MSFERQNWEKNENLVQNVSPVFDNYSPKVGTRFDFKTFEDDVSLQTKRHLSTSREDVLHDVPRYNRHYNGDIQPPKEAPPPIPTTQFSDEPDLISWRSHQRSEKQELKGTTWRSPQTSEKQGLRGTTWRSQLSSTTEESDLPLIRSQNRESNVDTNVNITHV